MAHPYYQLANGNLISKKRVDSAFELIASLRGGCSLVELSDSELFSKGDKTEAVMAFYKKHDCSIVEAKAAIEHLRGEDAHESNT